MAGTNQVTWTDKVNTRTLAIPIINKIDDTTVNQLKQKHNDLDTEMTDPATGLKKVVEDLGIDLGVGPLNTNAVNLYEIMTDIYTP
jgi:hypothetical protein